MPRSPRSQIDIPMWIYGAPIPHCFIHLVISAANTQVDVFNLEMNVYCRVSVSYFQWCIHFWLLLMFALCSFNTMGYLIEWLNFDNQIYLNKCWNYVLNCYCNTYIQKRNVFPTFKKCYYAKPYQRKVLFEASPLPPQYNRCGNCHNGVRVIRPMSNDVKSMSPLPEDDIETTLSQKRHCFKCLKQ